MWKAADVLPMTDEQTKTLEAWVRARRVGGMKWEPPFEKAGAEGKRCPNTVELG